MESLSFNSFGLLEHLAMLLTVTVISLRNVSKVFHIFITFMVYVLRYVLLNVYAILFL